MTFKVIKYFGDGCAPCKLMEPIFKQVESELEGEGFVFESRNISEDNYRDEAKSFGIRGIPTIIVFENGNSVATKTGMMTGDILRNFILESVRVK